MLNDIYQCVFVCYDSYRSDLSLEESQDLAYRSIFMSSFNDKNTDGNMHRYRNIFNRNIFIYVFFCSNNYFLIMYVCLFL